MNSSGKRMYWTNHNFVTDHLRTIQRVVAKVFSVQRANHYLYGRRWSKSHHLTGRGTQCAYTSYTTKTDDPFCKRFTHGRKKIKRDNILILTSPFRTMFQVSLTHLVGETFSNQNWLKTNFLIEIYYTQFSTI